MRQEKGCSSKHIVQRNPLASKATLIIRKGEVGMAGVGGSGGGKRHLVWKTSLVNQNNLIVLEQQ